MNTGHQMLAEVERRMGGRFSPEDRRAITDVLNEIAGEALALRIDNLRTTMLAVRDGLNSGAVDDYDAERMLDRALEANPSVSGGAS